MPRLLKFRIDAIRRFAAKPDRMASRILLVGSCIMLTFLAACTSGKEQRTSSDPADESGPPSEQRTSSDPADESGPPSEQRASSDPADNWGTPDVHDDFSGTNPEFELNNTGGVAHGWYNDGRFNITYPARGRWTWYSGSSSAMDFYVDVVVYNGDQCVDRDTAGLVYHYAQGSDAGLLFGVACGGGYFNGIIGALGAGRAVCLFTSSTPSEPGDLDCSYAWEHPPSSHINDGPGASNRLGIRTQGSLITLYINGHEVDSMTVTSTLPLYGEFALYLGSSQSDNASASFDDFSLWLDPSEGP